MSTWTRPVFHMHWGVGVLGCSVLTSHTLLYLMRSKSVVLLWLGVYVFVLKLGQEKTWRAADGTGCSLWLLNSDQPVLAGFISKAFSTTRNRYAENLHNFADKRREARWNERLLFCTCRCLSLSSEQCLAQALSFSLWGDCQTEKCQCAVLTPWKSKAVSRGPSWHLPPCQAQEVGKD